MPCRPIAHHNDAVPSWNLAGMDRGTHGGTGVRAFSSASFCLASSKCTLFSAIRRSRSASYSLTGAIAEAIATQKSTLPLRLSPVSESDVRTRSTSTNNDMSFCTTRFILTSVPTLPLSEGQRYHCSFRYRANAHQRVLHICTNPAAR